MHVVSDLQRRPNKSRLKSEKSIIPIYDICTLVQLVCLIIHATYLDVSSRRTFKDSIWIGNPLRLVDTIEYKTESCVYKTTRSVLYAFENVALSLYPSNVNGMFADLAIELRLAMFIAVFSLLLGIFNRNAVDMNFYLIEWRNFSFTKDLFSAAELALVSYLLRTALMAQVPSHLLSDYLQSCGLTTNGFLPFMPLAPMYVFVGVGYFTYLCGLSVYLWNALPKYGIMTEEQIREYKTWLHARRIRLQEAKVAAIQAKRATMRLQLMLRDRYAAGNAGPGDARETPQLRSASAPLAPFYDDYLAPNPPVNMPRRRDPNAGRTPAAFAPHMSSLQLPPAQRGEGEEHFVSLTDPSFSPQVSFPPPSERAYPHPQNSY